MTKQTVIKKLKAIHGTDLKEAVRDIILDEIADYEDPKGFFDDLFNHGCVSGMVGSLIYYKDTYAFAKKYIEDIMELKQEVEEEVGEPIVMKDDQLNWLAWFSFEHVAEEIAIEIGL